MSFNKNFFYESPIIKIKVVFAAVGDGTGKTGCSSSAIFMHWTIDVSSPRLSYGREDLYYECRKTNNPVVVAADHSIALATVAASK